MKTKELIAKERKERYLNDPVYRAHTLAKCKQWREANKEKKRICDANYRANNPEKARGWKRYKANQPPERLKALNHASYIRNKTTINAKNKATMVRLRSSVVAGYGGRCTCCGEADARFLTIDHVYNDGGIERKNGLYGYKFLKYILAEDFPEKHQLLCFNCNYGKNRFGGTCPHKLVADPAGF